MKSDGSGLTNLTNHPAGDWVPAWSPNGQQLAFVSDRSGPRAIYVMSAGEAGPRQVTEVIPGISGIVWSPDGSRIAFRSQVWDPNALDIYWVNSDGTGLTEVYSQSGYGGRITWSVDGQRILFDADVDGDFKLLVVKLDGSELRTVADSERWDTSPAWSPDGRRLAFVSDRSSGMVDIWVANHDGSGAQNVTGPVGGVFGPVWSPNSRWVAFMSGGRGLYKVRPDGSDLTKLSDLSFMGVEAEWSWSPNSTRIAFAAPGEVGHDIYVVRANGRKLSNLTSHPAQDSHPVWRPAPMSMPLPFEVAMIDHNRRLVLGDLDTGEVLSVDIECDSYQWSPDRRWLAAHTGDRSELWLVNARSGSFQQVPQDSGTFIGIASWSPLSNLIAFWAYTYEGTGLGLHVYDVHSGTYYAIPGTDIYNCNYGEAGWSYDQRWIVFTAAQCTSNRTERVVVSSRVDGSEISTQPGWPASPYPSPANYRLALSVWEGNWALYLADFTSLETSLHRIDDDLGRQLIEPRWLSNGMAFYAATFNWYRPEIVIVDAVTGRITPVSVDIVRGPSAWSPNNTHVGFDNDGRTTLLEVATGSLTEWGESAPYVCGYHWTSTDNLAAVLMCEHVGQRLYEVSAVHHDGTRKRIGEGVYREISVVSPKSP